MYLEKIQANMLYYEKMEPLDTVGGNVNWFNRYEKQ